MIFIDNQMVVFPAKLRDRMMDEIGKGKKIVYPSRLTKKVALYSPEGNSTGRVIEETPTVRSFPLSERMMLDVDPASPSYLMPSESGSMVTVAIGKALRVANGFAEGVVPDRFKEPRVLKQGDYELYWYLKHICGYVENGEAGKKNRDRAKHFRIEDKAGDAKVKTTGIRSKSAVEFKLTGAESETGITDTKMAELAYVYRVASPKDHTRDELAMEILKRVESDQRVKDYSKGSDSQGYEFFLSMLKDVQSTRFRVLVQRSIDEEFITFDANQSAWRFVKNKRMLGTPEYYGQLIVKVPPGRDANEIILSKVKTDKEFYDSMVEAIETGEVTAEVPEVEEKPLEEMSMVEILEAQAKEQEKDGDIKGAIKTLESLMVENKAMKNIYAMKKGKLAKQLETASA